MEDSRRSSSINSFTASRRTAQTNHRYAQRNAGSTGGREARICKTYPMLVEMVIECLL